MKKPTAELPDVDNAVHACNIMFTQEEAFQLAEKFIQSAEQVLQYAKEAT